MRATRTILEKRLRELEARVPPEKRRLRVQYVFQKSDGTRSEPVDVRGYEPPADGIQEDILTIVVISTKGAPPAGVGDAPAVAHEGPEEAPATKAIEDMTDAEVEAEVAELEAELERLRIEKRRES